MYNNANKADEIYKRKLEQDPSYDKKLVEKWRQEMPDEFKKFMLEQVYGRHIMDRSQYEDAVRDLRWANGKGRGAKWDADEITNKSGIDFEQEGYSPLDYSATVNALYADYNNVFTEPSYYLKMAKQYLKSKNYPDRPEERAYNDMEMRNRRYDYRNTYGYNYRNNYDYRDNHDYYDNYNYRNGYNEQNSYRDRDNDGKFNEGR